MPYWFLFACTSGEETVLVDPVDDTDTFVDVEVTDLTARVHDTMGSIVVLSWTQDVYAIAHAEYSFDGGDWLSSEAYRYDAGAHELPLLGVPFGAEVTWRLVAGGTPAAEDARIETGAVPAGLPQVDEVSGDGWDPDVRWILGSISPRDGSGSAWTVIVDRAGRPVWAKETPGGRTTFAPRPSADGTELLVDYNSWWGTFDGGATSQVVRFDITGEELGRWATPGLIHPFTQLDDGTIAWAAAQGGLDYTGEVLAVLDEGGEVRTLFDCNTFSAERGGDLCGANALTWSAATGTYLLSVYTLDTVIEVDSSGEPVRWFGGLAGAWGFADADARFVWQHGAHYLDDGHLLLSARRSDSVAETVAREYVLDDDAEELTEVWSYGEGEGVYAETYGEARRLPGGNTLVNYGSAARMREVTPGGDVVWDLRWEEGATLGTTYPLEDLYPFLH